MIQEMFDNFFFIEREQLKNKGWMGIRMILWTFDLQTESPHIARFDT